MFNYATKSDLKNTTYVNMSQFTNTNLKSEVDKLDIDKLSELDLDKLKTVSTDLSELNHIV